MPRLQPSDLERDASRRYESCRSPVLFRSLFCGRGARPFLEFGPCGLKTENRCRTVLCDNPIVRDVCENRYCNLRNRIGYRSHALPNTFCTGFVAVFGSSLSLGAAFFVHNAGWTAGYSACKTAGPSFSPAIWPAAASAGKISANLFFFIHLTSRNRLLCRGSACGRCAAVFSVVCACRFI